MIRALVVEDSATARELIAEILRSDSNVEVVGEAVNGVQAVEMTKRLRPDVVTMDIRMPTMDGFEATRAIMAEVPTPIVIITGSFDAREVEVSMQALRLGALTVLPKPVGPDAPDFEEQSQRLLQTVKTMSEVKVVRRRLGQTPHTGARHVLSQSVRPRIVAVAASTGGPAALARILADLPADFPLPLLVVQHIAKGFVEGFAAWLNSTSALPVKVAEQGEAIRPRTVYIAPDDRHLAVEDRSTLLISSAPPIEGFRPSGTFLFQSVAKSFGNSAVAVILTGMGQDGLVGLRAIHAAGGLVVAQDETTSVIFGMPGVAVASGVADEMLRLDAIAPRLEELVFRGRERT